MDMNDQNVQMFEQFEPIKHDGWNYWFFYKIIQK